MSQFTEFCHISPIPKRKLWIVDKNLYRELGEEGSGEFICVPAGFIFDGSTIPDIATRITGRQKIDPQTISAAAIHDYGWVEKNVPIYKLVDGVYTYSHHNTFTRKEWDEIYLQGCIACGCPEYKAYIQYGGIRTFGYPIRAGWIRTTK